MLDYLREKNLDAWLGGYARHLASNVVKPTVEGPRHLLFAICDHYEPLWDTITTAHGDARVQAWAEGYLIIQRPSRYTLVHLPRLF